MDEDSPPSLEELAFEVSYKEILSNLILCHDHRPKEKKLKWLPFSSLLSMIPYFESEQLIAIVRSRLDKYLLGTMGDETRKKYVTKFHESVTEYGRLFCSDYSEQGEELEENNHERKEECLVDLWAFLDCVLDDSFEELETHVAYPGCEPSPRLIQTITDRSPLLKKLDLNFQFMNEQTKSEILRPMILSLGSFDHLTDLQLHFPNGRDVNLRASLLSLLGDACPLLTKLHVVGGGVFSEKEIYGLLMGEEDYDELSRGTEEPKWLEDSLFSHLKVPEEFLSPICCTLRELSLFGCVPSSSSTSEIYGSSAIFILRNLSLLKKLHLPLPTAVAVKGLYEESNSESEFGNDCHQAFPCKVEGQGPSQPNSESSSFPGSLSLTSIDGVNAFDKTMLLAVGRLCPLLQEASFFSFPTIRFPSGINFSLPNKDGYSRGYSLDDLISTDELETYLNEWPKLTSITLQDFRPEHVASFLKVFGANLFQLRLSGCKFSVRQLLSCPKLEILHIGEDCTLIEDPIDGMDASLNQFTLLPQLKELHSGICWGSSWYLLENISTLVSLRLSCCHIGSREKGSKNRPITVGANSQSEWNCVGLTFTMLFNLAPRLPKLKRIVLPFEINEPHLYDQLAQQNPRIEFFFYCHPSENKCPYI